MIKPPEELLDFLVAGRQPQSRCSGSEQHGGDKNDGRMAATTTLQRTPAKLPLLQYFGASAAHHKYRANNLASCWMRCVSAEDSVFQHTFRTLQNITSSGKAFNDFAHWTLAHATSRPCGSAGRVDVRNSPRWPHCEIGLSKSEQYLKGDPKGLRARRGRDFLFCASDIVVLPTGFEAAQCMNSQGIAASERIPFTTISLKRLRLKLMSNDFHSGCTFDVD
jgi:hypothetical protein